MEEQVIFKNILNGRKPLKSFLQFNLLQVRILLTVKVNLKIVNIIISKLQAKRCPFTNPRLNINISLMQHHNLFA